MPVMGRIALPRIEDLTRLRTLYRRRGPRDGQTGITPDGKVGTPWRYNLVAVVADAQHVLEMDDPTLARWREGMGLNDPPAPVKSWADQCPSRGPGLTHARTREDPVGICVHCQVKLSG